ncbi:MAG: LexA family protein, partial [Candidatus Xenobia bacterium]
HAEDVPRWWVRHAEKVFLLRVVGDSMSPTLEAGDLAIVMPGPTARDGDIVVAVVGTEATLKRYHRQRTRVVLKSDNSAHPDIVVSSELRINGRVVALLRQFKGA